MGQIGYSSGFAFESSFGPGNYELFIPWVGGGFAHYWRNRASWDSLGWQGPIAHGTGKITSLAVHEGDFSSGDNDPHRNFEMLVVDNGRIAHWARSNVPPYDWWLTGFLPGISNAVSCVLGRSHERETDHSVVHNSLYAIVALSNGGLVELARGSDFVWQPWFSLKQRISGLVGYNYEQILANFVGVGWALGTVGTSYVDFNDARGYGGDSLLVATTHAGVCEAWETDLDPYVLHGDGADWSSPAGLGPGSFGRPCAIQSDRGRRVPFLGLNHQGNYELFVPSVGGGIRHYWSDNNSSRRVWNPAPLVGQEKYDEVTVFQSGDEDIAQFDTPPLQLFAWRRGETWVHHFWQVHTDNGFFWFGPETVGYRAPTAVDPIPWEITCAEFGFNDVRNKHNRWVRAVGGRRNGQRWHMTKDQVIVEIHSGRKKFVTIGADGSTAPVYVVDRIDPDAGVFHPYITTAVDRHPDNNLLNLPRCPMP